MPDWFMLLTPLLLLVFVLLFCFVGCGLEIEGAAISVEKGRIFLKYPKDLGEGVKIIKLTYTIQGKDDPAFQVNTEFKPNLMATMKTTLFPSVNIPLTCTCECVVELEAGTATVEPPSLKKETSDNYQRFTFTLNRDTQDKNKFILG